MKQLKKVLKSALIFAMVIALCGTTMAKAYAAYANIIIEHVWEDNHNKPDENENETPDGEEAEGPRDKVGQVDVNVEGAHLEDEKWVYDYEQGWITVPGNTTVTMDGSESGAAAGMKQGYLDAEKVVNDLLASGKDSEGRKAVDAWKDAYEAYRNSWNEEEWPELQAELDKAAAEFKNWIKENYCGDFGNDQNMKDAYGEAYPDAVTEDMVWNPAISDIFWNYFGAVNDQNDADSVAVNVDPNAAGAEESVQNLANALAPDLANQVSDNSDMSLSKEEADNIAEYVAGELQAFAASEGTVDEGDVWKLTVVGNECGGYSELRIDEMPEATLTEESKENLEANGYESTLTIKVVVTKGYNAELDEWENSTYVSTDNGETWIEIGNEDAGAKTVDELGLFEDEGSSMTITYTFTHTRAASYEKPEEPEDPKDPDPKPDPEDPKDPDPKPDPKPDPDPVIPQPTPDEDIPDPDVPLAEPDPEEPEAVEPPEEIELDEPDVPLADIPQTGDISDLWYGAALMAAVGLAALLYQERRSKKTA